MSRQTVRLALHQRKLDLDPNPMFDRQSRTRAEKALGNRIAEDVWQHIDDLTKLQSTIALNEISPPTVKSIQIRLERLVRAAEIVRQKLSDDPGPLSKRWSAKKVHHYFFENSPWTDKTPDHLVSLFLHSLDALLAVTSVLEEELEYKDLSATALPQGTSWDLWIVLITRAFGEHKLPSSVRKDQLGRSSSPFVLFIQELQKACPKHFRRFTHSSDSLAQGITRARSKWAVDSGNKKKKRSR